MSVRTVNIHEAKTQLSRLVDEAAEGKPFVIAKAGKPKVLVTALPARKPARPRRIGGLAGQIVVPDAATFDALARNEIAVLFTGGE